MPNPPACVACKSWLPDWAGEYDTGPQVKERPLRVTNLAEYGFCTADVNPEEVDGNKAPGDRPGCLRTRHNACCPAFDRKPEPA